VGVKDHTPGAGFRERNGLVGGQLYVWEASNGDSSPDEFNGTGSVRAGTWAAINARNIALAGSAGYDAAGYKDDFILHAEADALGAFLFSRPEDVSTSPTDGTMVAFNSTGRGSVFTADNWGDTYIVDLDFTVVTAPTASVRLLYDSDDGGGGQFASPEAGLRNQDNVDWADDGFLYVQEDQANQVGNFGALGKETSIWRLDPTNGAAVRLAMTDRDTVLPLGSTDGNISDFGNWESSGIIDVSSLFDGAPGTLFLFSFQAHSVTDGQIAAKSLYEGGQVCFLERGLERGAFALSPNTGVLTLWNPDAVSNAVRPEHELRLQAFDGVNTTFAQAAVVVTNTPVLKSNQFTVATFNTSLFRETANTLINDLAGVNNTQAQKIARVIQRINADVILVNEFDYDAAGKAARRFRENYLEVGQSGEDAVHYPYSFHVPSNTGIASGFDLDNNGSAVTTPGAPGYGEDAFGFGVHPGQFAFVVLSKFPIDTANIRTFQNFLWKDMPGALLPDNPNIAGPADWYSTAELNVFRLSSKNHADVPVLVNGTPVHILASHPTPPVFDDPASGQPWIAGVDHNGRRNSDEIRFWSDYVTPAASGYIYDDKEWAAATNSTPATPSGGLPVNARFVLVGDQNADEDEGDSTPPAIRNVITNVLYNSAFVPGGGAGPGPDDTAAFSGGVRVDYVLPSTFGMQVLTGAVFWPSALSGDPIVAALDATDHHLVYLHLSLTGVEVPPSTDLVSYYASAQGLSGTALRLALHDIIDDHVVIDYGLVDDIMQVIDQSPTNTAQLRLLYSSNTLAKTAFNISGGWNREHVWPRSDGVGDEGADYSDLHHLFPARDSVNSLRSNLPFDEGTSVVAFDPFAPESFSDGNSWEPLDRDKGVVARALLYMMTRYDGSDPLTTDLMLADNPSPVGTHGVLATLLEWNRAFPPTEFERARNNAIYAGVSVDGVIRAQGNRNPFVDFPQLADAMFLGTGTNSFGKWQLQRFTLAQLLDPAVSDAGADAEGDGLTAYEEFVFNGNPFAGDDVPVRIGMDGAVVCIEFDRPKGAAAPSATLWSATALNPSDWAPVPAWEASAMFTDLGDHERVKYSVTLGPLDSPRFWRVTFD
jgi:3-phytase